MFDYLIFYFYCVDFYLFLILIVGGGFYMVDFVEYEFSGDVVVYVCFG